MDEEFWEFASKQDFISLCETWMKDKSWEKMKEWLSDSYDWVGCMVRKVKKKRRGRDVNRKRKEWVDRGNRLGEMREERIVLLEITRGKKKWIIISIYNRKEWKELEQV